MQNKFAKIEPNPLSIIISKDNENNNNYNITIHNLTNKYIIFKFLINTKGILLAKPSTSYISPSQNISVEIIVNNHSNLSLSEYKKTKILVMIIPYNGEINSVEQAKNLFQDLKNKEIERQDILVDLNFTMEEIINTDINKNNNKQENMNNNEEKLIFENNPDTKKQLISKNEEILKNLEINKKKLENLTQQNNKVNEKSKPTKTKKYNFDNLIMVSIILLGLIAGSNFANLYNKLFKK